MLRLDAVTFLVPDANADGRFWAMLLDRPLEIEPESVRVGGDEQQVALRFRTSDRSADDQPALVHLHVTTTDDADRDRILARALDAGARHLDVGQLPEERHIVLADPVGNAFCVIEPGNNYLAGCGRLGEVAGDSTREVGVFWSEALAWPLVWDSDGETAIQSPAGGTKLAWGGPPVESRTGGRRQRFELVTDDVTAETERLVSLGATHVRDLDEDPGVGAELADPDGNDLLLTHQKMV